MASSSACDSIRNEVALFNLQPVKPALKKKEEAPASRMECSQMITTGCTDMTDRRAAPAPAALRPSGMFVEHAGG